jgi:hypothetical protein
MTRRRLVKPLTIPSPVAYLIFAVLIVIATAPTGDVPGSVEFLKRSALPTLSR